MSDGESQHSAADSAKDSDTGVATVEPEKRTYTIKEVQEIQDGYWSESFRPPSPREWPEDECCAGYSVTGDITYVKDQISDLRRAVKSADPAIRASVAARRARQDAEEDSARASAGLGPMTAQERRMRELCRSDGYVADDGTSMRPNYSFDGQFASQKQEDQLRALQVVLFHLDGLSHTAYAAFPDNHRAAKRSAEDAWERAENVGVSRLYAGSGVGSSGTGGTE